MNNVTDLLKTQPLSEINSYSFPLYTLPIIIFAFISMIARVIHIIWKRNNYNIYNVVLIVSIIPDFTYCFSFVALATPDTTTLTTSIIFPIQGILYHVSYLFCIWLIVFDLILEIPTDHEKDPAIEVFKKPSFHVLIVIMLIIIMILTIFLGEYNPNPIFVGKLLLDDSPVFSWLLFLCQFLWIHFIVLLLWNNTEGMHEPQTFSQRNLNPMLFAVFGGVYLIEHIIQNYLKLKMFWILTIIEIVDIIIRFFSISYITGE